MASLSETFADGTRTTQNAAGSFASLPSHRYFTETQGAYGQAGGCRQDCIQSSNAERGLGNGTCVDLEQDPDRQVGLLKALKARAASPGPAERVRLQRSACQQ
ncbi:hypothetical protein GN956_G21672 [Arapaima gigas]